MTTHQPPGSGLLGRSIRSDLPAIGAVAGIVGPLLFSVGFIVQGLFRRGEYDPIAQTVSVLETGPQGWIQQLNFFVFAILMMIFAAGLSAGLHGGRQRIGAAMVAWWGIGLLMAGLFPLRENVAGQTYDPTGLHQPNGTIFFASVWIGLAVLSWCLRQDPYWRGVARYALITSVTLAVLFVVMGALAIPSSAPLHPWAGLLQRAVLVVWFPCVIVLATRLLRQSRGRSPESAVDHSAYAV
jgi:Protein of unknown function (DUF998)